MKTFLVFYQFFELYKNFFLTNNLEHKVFFFSSRLIAQNFSNFLEKAIKRELNGDLQQIHQYKHQQELQKLMLE